MIPLLYLCRTSAGTKLSFNRNPPATLLTNLKLDTVRIKIGGRKKGEGQSDARAMVTAVTLQAKHDKINK